MNATRTPVPRSTQEGAASVRYTTTEVFRFERGYGVDPVENKANVVLTIDHAAGHMSITSEPILWDNAHTENHPHRFHCEMPLLLHRGENEGARWAAIGRLMTEAAEFGQQRLDEGREDTPSKQ